MMHLALSLTLLAPFASPSQQATEPAAKKIPILLVSGANNHDWRWTTPSLQRIFERSGRFDVDVTFEPAKDLADAERVGRAQAIVLDYNGPDWGEPAKTNFLEAVTNGTGVVVVHAADNSGVGWEEYERLVADLWRKGTGHGRFHAFDVAVTDRDHPVTRTLPTLLKHPDELYHRLVNPHGVERRVLATAFSDEKTGGTGANEPMVIVRQYGKGRVFHTPLGHVWTNNAPSQASHNDPQFQGLMIRGTEWAATGSVTDEQTKLAAPSGADAAQWQSLMDRGAWQSLGGADVPAGWAFQGDTIARTAASGDIVTRELYGDFELAFEWKTVIAGNSGVKYRIPKGAKQAIGPEFQLLDAWADEGNAQHRAGAIYGVVAAIDNDAPEGVWGEFHTARIVSVGTEIKHYLDGVLVAKADTSSPEWDAAVADSKFKGKDGYAATGLGHILLQDHGDEVWIRGMRVRRLDKQAAGAGGAARGEGAALFPNADLSAWSNVGDATYAVEDNVLVGDAGPKRKQSFLVSKEQFGDFTLDVDVKIAVLGNSGIQLRSHVNDKGRLFGYQCEIDPTPRSWSGGIFDEARRGWLDPLDDNEAARKAFDLTGWNHYKIECKGPRIRSWINGTPAANLLDGLDLDGSVAFQIHGGDDDIQIRWREARIQRQGSHAWESQGAIGTDAVLMSSETAPGIRARVKGERSVLRFHNAKQETIYEIDLFEEELWRQGSMNTVTVLFDGDHVVVQLAEKTARDKAIQGAVGVSFPSVEAIDEAWLCRKQ